MGRTCSPHLFADQLGGEGGEKVEEAKYIYEFFSIAIEEKNEWFRCKEMKEEGEIIGNNINE